MPLTACSDDRHSRMTQHYPLFLAYTAADRRFDAGSGKLRGRCTACGTAVEVAARSVPVGQRFATCHEDLHDEMRADVRVFRESIRGLPKRDEVNQMFLGTCSACLSDVAISELLVLAPPAGKKVIPCPRCRGRKRCFGENYCEACEAHGAVLVACAGVA